MQLREMEIEEQLKAVEAERAKVAAERTQLEVIWGSVGGVLY